MSTPIEKTIRDIRFHEVQRFAQMTVMPLSLPEASNKFTYIMLSEALTSGSIVINEVSEGGSVPELIARNTGKVPVLIMDGEELAGAKQNRVANTSILVPPLSKIVIPVS